jgi:hypothetical protein
MLKAHIDAIENSLVSISKIPANSGHSLHKGTPRENFIKTFLQNHLSGNVSIGTGEIIDSSSVPGAERNQHDVIIYKKKFPKIDFGGNISGFLIESVIATIEVKSTLDRKGVDQSMEASFNSKSLNSNKISSYSTGWVPPKILNYVIAYNGPSKIDTIDNWVTKSYLDLNIPRPTWNQQNRLNVCGTALDGIFLLKKGFWMLDNTPLSFNHKNDDLTHGKGDTAWVAHCTNGSLLMLFLLLQQACINIEGEQPNLLPYIAQANFQNIKSSSRISFL